VDRGVDDRMISQEILKNWNTCGMNLYVARQRPVAGFVNVILDLRAPHNGGGGAFLNHPSRVKLVYLISNFRRVLYVVCFLLGNSPASEFYMPTFRNTLFHLHRQVGK
jgi:hypothetical protein